MSVIDPFMGGVQGAAVGPLTDRQELAMLRHDLDVALQGLTGGIARIDAAALDGEMRAQFERIAAAARTLEDLVGPASAGRVAGEPAAPELAVADFMQHVAHRHTGEARERGLGFRVETEGGFPASLRLDPVLLGRVIDNLVGNAVRFSGAGEVRLVAGRDREDRPGFRILDEGPGADPEAIAGARGSGQRLGLAIARVLTERLGGELALGNRAAGGFEAAVRFPAAIVPEVVPEVVPPLRVDAPDLRGLRVLLAEDNPTNQMVASQMLTALNAEVTVCGDGVEALDCFDRQPVDLVVVDIEMPRLSGLDVIRAIRARSDARAQVPIVALTAYAMREHRERIAAAGANGLISKPITSVEALRRGLAAHLAPGFQTAAFHAPLHADAPEDATEADGGPVIDTAIFAALCEAVGPETMAELLEKVIADLISAQRELSDALVDLDRGPIRSASHILISVAGALGAVRLQACARMVNGVAHGDATDRIADGVRRCIAEIDAAVAFARACRAAS